MADLKLKFKMPDEETLAKYIPIKGEKGDPGDPTKTSQLENDSDFTTNAALNSGLATKADATTVQSLTTQVEANTNAIATLIAAKIAVEGGSSSGVNYFKLCDLVRGFPQNTATVNIRGKIGGYGRANSENIDITIIASESEVTARGDYFTPVAKSDRRVDFVVYYDETTETATLYMRTRSWYIVNLIMEVGQSINSSYDGTYTSTTPSGTLVWSFQDDTNIQINYNGIISADIDGDAQTVNGHTVDTDVPYGAVFTDTIYDDSTVVSEIDSLRSQIAGLAEGSPLVASSVSEMTDTTRIYVNTTDGHWYYHDGSAWTDGGIYQATELPDDTVKIQHLSDELKDYHLFDMDWIITGASNNRVRLIRNCYFTKGTIFEFDNTDTSLYWAVDKITGGTTTNVLPWGRTTTRYEVVEDAYYSVVIRYSNNQVIPEENIDYLSSHAKIYRPTRNTAGKLLNWYAVRQPFAITEKVTYNGTSNQVHILGTGTDFFMMFENYIEFFSRANWSKTRMTPNRLITYELGDYGTVTWSNNYPTIDVYIPDNYALILDTMTGVMSVKDQTEVVESEAILLRNASGHATCGAFREIYDFWNKTEISSEITSLSNEVADLSASLDEVGKSANGKVNYLFATSWQKGGIYDGFNMNETRCRTVNPLFLEAGTVIEFDNSDPTINWCWESYSKKSDLTASRVRNSGWLSRDTETLGADYYYGICLRFADNRMLSADDVETLSSKIKIYRPLTDAEPTMPIDCDLTVKSVNHRGWYLAPENTLPAYQESKEHGFKYVETDVSFTSDGVAVCLHDATIDRTSNGSGNINDLTFAQVREYDFGSWKSSVYAGTQIPTLEEFVVLCRNIGLYPYIELKDSATYTEAQIQSIVDTVNLNGMKGKVTYISFTSTYLEYVKNYDNQARLGFLVGNTISSDNIATAVSLKTANNEVFIDAGSSAATAEQVALCAAANLPLELWTINDSATILALNNYVTGITSDRLIAGEVLYENNIG